MTKRLPLLLIALLALVLAGAACGDEGEADGAPTAAGAPERLTIYSGRNEDLVGPLIERFRGDTGIRVQVRYGDSAELAATLLEEGDSTPANVFFSQDAGALGALAQAKRLAELPRPLLERVGPRFRSSTGEWVGTSGRARVIAYDKREVQPEDLPRSVLGLTGERFRGRVAWAPTNASFQTFVTALRLTEGEAAARRWLERMQANDVQSYENNIAIRDAIANGEVELGLINHYYVAEAIAQEGTDYPVGILLPPNDVGGLVNVAGVAIVAGTEHRREAERFVRYLLEPAAQHFFSQRTKEYPLIDAVRPPKGFVRLEDIEAPDINLNRLSDLQGTVELLQDTGAL
jgi:iron(III) transport system substrate-binding protein